MNERKKLKLCTKKGCRAYKMKNSNYCWFHAPEDEVDKKKKFKGSIIDAIESSKYFGSLFKNQESWDNWKIVMKGIFALPMTASEGKVFHSLTGRTSPLKHPKEVYIIAGRRSGKSWISSVIAVYLSFFRDYSKYLNRGEKGHVIIIASDRKQSQIILNYIRAILEVPIFAKEVHKILREEIYLHNGIVISIKTSSVASPRGLTAVAVLCDETAFWRNEGRNPDSQIMASLRPTMATIPNSLLCCISSPHNKSGIIFKSWKEYYGIENDHTLVVQSPSHTLNPTLDEQWINEQLELDWETNKAEYLAQWREDVSQYLSDDVIDNCTIPKRGNLPKVNRVHYRAFCDASSGVLSRDAHSFTLCVGHKEKDITVIDYIAETQPPFSPHKVIELYAKIMKSYGINSVVGDKWSLGFVAGEFQKNGVQYQNSKLSSSELYLEASVYLNQGSVELPDNKKLIRQLRSLERKTRSGGKDLIHAFKEGSDDIANSVCGLIADINLSPQYSLDSPEIVARLPFQSKKRKKSRHEILQEAEKEMDEWMREQGATDVYKEK